MRLILLGAVFVLAQILPATAQDRPISADSSTAGRRLGSSTQQAQGIPIPIRPSAFSRITALALDANYKPLPNRAVRSRDTRSGRVVALGLTDRTGQFVFQNVDPGNYVVELVSPSETVLAASGIITVSAGDSVSAVVKLPVNVRSLAGVLSHNAGAAAAVAATAAVSGVLAVQVNNCVSPPCEN